MIRSDFIIVSLFQIEESVELAYFDHQFMGGFKMPKFFQTTFYEIFISYAFVYGLIKNCSSPSK